MPRTPAAKFSSSAARAALSKLEDLSAERLARRLIERRAFEAVVWGMPAVNFELLCDATRAAKGAMNQVVYWSRLILRSNPASGSDADVAKAVAYGSA